MLAAAKAGDTAAARLVLSYAVGPPLPAADPDRLDANELEALRSRPNMLDRFALDPLTPERMSLFREEGGLVLFDQLNEYLQRQLREIVRWRMEVLEGKSSKNSSITRLYPEIKENAAERRETHFAMDEDLSSSVIEVLGFRNRGTDSGTARVADDRIVRIISDAIWSITEA